MYVCMYVCMYVRMYLLRMCKLNVFVHIYAYVYEKRYITTYIFIGKNQTCRCWPMVSRARRGSENRQKSWQVPGFTLFRRNLVVRRARLENFLA